MGYLKVIWKWLAGKKSNIGGGMLLIAFFISDVIEPEWKLSEHATLIFHRWQTTFNWIGSLFYLGGVTHQGVRYFQAQNANNPPTP